MKNISRVIIMSAALVLMTACGSKKEDLVETNSAVEIETGADATEETTTEAVTEETTTEDVSAVEETTEEVTTEVSKADPKKEETKPTEKPKKEETKPVAETTKTDESKPVKETPKKEETTTEKPAETKPSSPSKPVEETKPSTTEPAKPAHSHSYTVTSSTTGKDCKTAGIDTYTCSCGDSYTKSNNKFGSHKWNKVGGDPIYEPRWIADDGHDFGPDFTDYINTYMLEHEVGVKYDNAIVGYTQTGKYCNICEYFDYD